MGFAAFFSDLTEKTVEIFFFFLTKDEQSHGLQVDI